MYKLFISMALSPFVVMGAEKVHKSSIKRPNIILINMDDMGYGDLTVTGAQGYSTPNIDQLSFEGVRFTQFYSSSSVSSASRAGLMTGCYPNRISIYGAIKPETGIGVHPDEIFISQIVKEVGYTTAVVGKWHLGSEFGYLPLQRGFDEYFGLPYSNDMWPYGYLVRPGEVPTDRVMKRPELPLFNGNKIEKYIKTMDEQNSLTELYTKYAIDFIRRQQNTPFFLYFAHTMVHVPLPVSDKFRGKSEQGLFGDAMMEVDWSIGEVLKAVRETGMEENTLIIFTSDNGAWINFGMRAGSTGGLRDAKHVTYEGGQRVPCIMKWPAQIPAGWICNRLTSGIDILPTIAAIVGGKLPERKIDGVNILPLISGNKDFKPHDYLYYYDQKNQLDAVRDERFKLVEPHLYITYDGMLPHDDGTPGPRTKAYTDWALYDLRRDPGERYDIKSLYPEDVERLKQALDVMRKQCGDSNMRIKGGEVRPAGKVSR